MSTTLIVILIVVVAGILGYLFYSNLSAINTWLNGAPKVQFIVSTTPTVIPNNTFVKGNATTDTTMYYISGGEKHYVTLSKWQGENYPTYTIVDSATLAAYPSGSDY